MMLVRAGLGESADLCVESWGTARETTNNHVD